MAKLTSELSKLKGLIRTSKRPFSGDSPAFFRAISELRKEGFLITKDKHSGDYLVKATPQINMKIIGTQAEFNF